MHHDKELNLVLDEVYGIAWEKSWQRAEGTIEPIHIFSLIIPCDNSHSLPNVAEVRLCKVDLKFGVESVVGNLDTDAQRRSTQRAVP